MEPRTPTNADAGARTFVSPEGVQYDAGGFITRLPGEDALAYHIRCYDQLDVQYGKMSGENNRLLREVSKTREKNRCLEDALGDARKEITRLKEDNATLRAEASTNDRVESAIAAIRAGDARIHGILEEQLTKPRQNRLAPPPPSVMDEAKAYGLKMREEVDATRRDLRARGAPPHPEGYLRDAGEFPVETMRRNTPFTGEEYEQFDRIRQIYNLDFRVPLGVLSTDMWLEMASDFMPQRTATQLKNIYSATKRDLDRFYERLKTAPDDRKALTFVWRRNNNYDREEVLGSFPDEEEDEEPPTEDLGVLRCIEGPEADEVAHFIHFALLDLRTTYAEVVERDDLLAVENNEGRLALERRKAYDAFDAAAAAVDGGGGADDLRSCEQAMGTYLDDGQWCRGERFVPLPCLLAASDLYLRLIVLNLPGLDTEPKKFLATFLFCGTRKIALFERVFKPLFAENASEADKHLGLLLLEKPREALRSSGELARRLSDFGESVGPFDFDKWRPELLTRKPDIYVPTSERGSSERFLTWLREERLVTFIEKGHVVFNALCRIFDEDFATLARGPREDAPSSWKDLTGDKLKTKLWSLMRKQPGVVEDGLTEASVYSVLKTLHFSYPNLGILSESMHEDKHKLDNALRLLFKEEDEDEKASKPEVSMTERNRVRLRDLYKHLKRSGQLDALDPRFPKMWAFVADEARKYFCLPEDTFSDGLSEFELQALLVQWYAFRSRADRSKACRRGVLVQATPPPRPRPPAPAARPADDLDLSGCATCGRTPSETEFKVFVTSGRRSRNCLFCLGIASGDRGRRAEAASLPGVDDDDDDATPIDHPTAEDNVGAVQDDVFGRTAEGYKRDGFVVDDGDELSPIASVERRPVKPKSQRRSIKESSDSDEDAPVAQRPQVRPSDSDDLAIGDKMRKKFPGSGWFDGTVERFEGEKVVVKWSDGDTTTLKRAAALKHRVGRAAAVDALAEPDVEADEEDKESVGLAEGAANLDVAPESAAFRKLAGVDGDRKAAVAAWFDGVDAKAAEAASPKTPSTHVRKKPLTATAQGDASVEAERAKRQLAYAARWSTTAPEDVQEIATASVQDYISQGVDLDEAALSVALIILPEDGHMASIASEAARNGGSSAAVRSAVLQAGGIPEVADAVGAAYEAYQNAVMTDSN